MQSRDKKFILAWGLNFWNYFRGTMELTPQQLIFTLIFATLIGGWTGYLAKSRGRDLRVWALAGFFFGLFGLITLLFLPNLSEKEEDTIDLVIEPVVVDHNLKEWFYLEGTEQNGPIDYSGLQNLWADKKISSTTYIWCEGMEEWKTIQDCRLFTS